VAWLATQAAWVHTGHTPDYTVLTLRNWTSIPVICGGTMFVVATFFAARGLCRLRDRWTLPPADDVYVSLSGSAESV